MWYYIGMIPWLTSESIKFLEDFFIHHHSARMLEFGSGNSTVWFAQRGAFVTSIEHDIRWYTQVQQLCIQKKITNVDLRLIQHNYASICATFESNTFDIILVDGKDRIRCVEESMRLVKPGGILMLDDAERPSYAPLFQLLHTWPLTISEEYKPNATGALGLSKTVWWQKPN